MCSVREDGGRPPQSPPIAPSPFAATQTQTCLTLVRRNLRRAPNGSHVTRPGSTGTNLGTKGARPSPLLARPPCSFPMRCTITRAPHPDSPHPDDPWPGPSRPGLTMPSWRFWVASINFRFCTTSLATSGWPPLSLPLRRGRGRKAVRGAFARAQMARHPYAVSSTGSPVALFSVFFFLLPFFFFGSFRPS